MLLEFPSMPFTFEDLADIVKNRTFDRLIGEAESQFFDGKAQPYLFDLGDDAKREFAKDVSAFANATGGYIFLGLDTKRTALHLGDEVTEVRPIPAAMFDPDRHRKILEEWLHPQPMQVDVQWAPYGSDSSKGIGVIYVPEQNERSKPFLITRAFGDKKTTELLIGYAERRVDRTQVRGIVEIQQAIRNGLDIERTLAARLDNIEVLLSRHLAFKKKTETMEAREELLSQRIERALALEPDKSGRRMVIAAIPLESAELKSIFSEQAGSIWHKLESPPRLRAAGWGLPSRGNAEPIQGELLRVIDLERMLIDLYRDGTLLLLGGIHRDFLAWSDKNDSQLHPLALIELIVNFARFFRLVLEDLDAPPGEIEFRLMFVNMLGTEKARLVSGPVGRFGPTGSVRYAPAELMSVVRRFRSESYDPDSAAFSLVREVYAWFGHSEEAIPYVKTGPAGKSIDPEQITNIR